MDLSTPSPELRRLDLALEAAGLGDYSWDIGRDVFHVSERLAAITGLTAGDQPARKTQTLYDLVHPQDRAATRAAVDAAVKSGGSFDAEYRFIRPDNGRTMWLRVYGLALRDQSGAAVEICGVVRDVSEQKLQDEQRRALMSESDHRVKNVLAAVQALAAQTAKRTSSLEGFLEAFLGRVKAMAAANALLGTVRWRGAAIADLARAELGDIAPGQTRRSGPELFLTPRAANALALALHELAANALHFGALSTEAGRVEVNWAAMQAGGFELTWSETGGPPVTPPARTGFGGALLAHVTGPELNGDVTVDYRAGGVFARLVAGPQALTEPARAPEPASAAAWSPALATPGRADLRGVRVLVVEDAALLALELETGLELAGAEVIGPAFDLDAAMTFLSQKFDAAVLDANLNGRSVTPLARALAARGTPFVIATAYGEQGGAPEGFDAPIIRKPYDVLQVALAVAALLGR